MEKNNTYIIVPGCSDLNRGDQALVWETMRLAQESGFTGEFYFTAERNEPVKQSIARGLHVILPVLEHPSRKFKSKDNISYTRTLKIKWGLVALFDLLGSLFLLCNSTRRIARLFLSSEKRNVLNSFENADAIFIKGGGLLQTYGGVSSTYSMYFWVYPLLLAHKMGKPVFVMPNSFGPFEGPFVKQIARAALSKCRVLTSRETLSEEMVKNQLGLCIETYPDLAFTMPKADLCQKTIYTQYNLPYDRQLVAITMRPYRFPGADDPAMAYATFKREMGEFIEWLYDYGYMPVIVEHTLAVNAHENDAACIKDVVLGISPDKYRIIANNNYDCYDLKCIYSYCNYIVGTRFHSVIFSFGSDVPGIAIAYTGNKSQGIMHDIGLDDYVVQIGDVSADCLKSMFGKLVLNRDNVVDKIRLYRIRSESQRQQLVRACAIRGNVTDCEQNSK